MSVAIPMVRALIEVIERSGVARQEFLRRAKIPESRLNDGSEYFTLEAFAALQQLALQLTRDEAFGLHFGEYTTEAAFDLVGHLVSHAPTLREALGLSVEFSQALFGEGHLVLEERRNVAQLRHQFRRISPLVDRMHAEFVMTGFARMIRIIAGPDAAISGAFFEHGAPAYRHEYRRLFDGAEKFGQECTGLEFPRALLDARQLHQHPRLFSLLHAEAHRTLDGVKRGVGYAERLRRYLSVRPPHRIPNMDVAASDLGMSVRSLRRRLADEGTSYRELVQATLEEAAARVLRTRGRSVEEAARETGFSCAGAFDRAFKQWTGITPTEFRRRQSDAS